MTVVRSVAPGRASRDAADRVDNILAPIASSHAPQHLVMAVLDGDIQVGENPGVGGHDGQEFRGDAGRVAVEQTDPPEAVNGGQFLKQRRDPRAARHLPAVGGGVLGHQDEFFDPGGGEIFGLLHQGLEGAAPQLAADLGDETEGAAVAAALGDLQIGQVAGRGGVAGLDAAIGVGRGLMHQPGGPSACGRARSSGRVGKSFTPMNRSTSGRSWMSSGP